MLAVGKTGHHSIVLVAAEEFVVLVPVIRNPFRFCQQLLKKRWKKFLKKALFEDKNKCFDVFLLLRPSCQRTTEFTLSMIKERRENISYQLSPLSFRISFDVLRVLFAFFASKKKF